VENIIQTGHEFFKTKISIGNDTGFGVLVPKGGRKEMGRQIRNGESEL
jgi:hypothetical protein